MPSIDPRSGDEVLSKRRVILFDIDGTLISSQRSEREEGRRYIDAIRDVTGKEPSVKPSRFAGMVDPQICKILLAETGLSEEAIEGFLPQVIVQMGEVYRTMERGLGLNRGVHDLLKILADSPVHVLGVLTGNISAVGKAKLATAGLRHFFSEGFYADAYLDRVSLVEDAVKKCLIRYELSDRRRVFVVGDTPLDVKAANAAHATSVGISSGVYSIEQLSAEGAKRAFRDLTPTKELLAALDFVAQ